MYLALKLKFVKGRGYETYNTKKVIKEHKKQADVETEEDEQHEVPVPLVTHVNNILHSFFFPMLKCTSKISKLQFEWTVCAQILHLRQLQGAFSENKGVLHCEGYHYEEIFDEVMQTLMSEPFFTKRMEMLSRPDGFILYGKLGVDFFSTPEFLCPNTKIGSRMIRARPKFYIIIDNLNISLGIVDCSLYTHRIALKDDYHMK